MAGPVASLRRFYQYARTHPADLHLIIHAHMFDVVEVVAHDVVFAGSASSTGALITIGQIEHTMTQFMTGSRNIKGGASGRIVIGLYTDVAKPVVDDIIAGGVFNGDVEGPHGAAITECTQKNELCFMFCNDVVAI